MNTNYFKQNRKPIFMPDATYGIVNSLSWNDLEHLNTEAIVTNTLHLYLNYLTNGTKNYDSNDISRITDKSFRSFSNWKGGIITDSGGFQAYSFIKKGLGKINDDCLEFVSPKNRSRHTLTPEKSVEIQLALKSDVIIVLDDPIEPDSSKERIYESLHRTIKWAKICKNYFIKRLKEIQEIDKTYNPLIFSVIQGGRDFEMRQRCFDELSSIGFDGYGFGGWPLSANGKFFDELVEFNAGLVSKNIKESGLHKFNYAMGVGTPEDIEKCLNWGYDLFDCVLPTRNARHGYLYTKKGFAEEAGINYDVIRINSTKYENDDRVLDESSMIPELTYTSLKYLRYLFKIKDSNALRIASLNNMYFYNSLLNK